MTVHHHNRFIKIFYIFLLSNFLVANIKAPIILMHGFIGWGKDEIMGYPYWGGAVDLEGYLVSQGFEVYTVSMGPISSNWDRAIEAFYQIKGGQVNYGINHSLKFNILQKPEGKHYDGFYPQWDENHPVHIIGHSQGGQTARMLEFILKYTHSSEDSELLKDKHLGWIKSITTISAPHNGTIVADLINENLSFLQKITPFFGIMDDSSIEGFYDFDLDQWDLDRKKDESTSDYLGRLSNSRLNQSKNFSGWNLSIEGAKEFNDIYETDKNVYYFSYCTYSTTKMSNGSHIPDRNMSITLWPSSLIIGQSSSLSADWYMNDGVVSTISMKFPVNSNDKSEPNKTFDKSNIEKGIWQVMDLTHMDHHGIIGHKLLGLDKEEIKSFYFKMCDRLYNLD